MAKKIYCGRCGQKVSKKKNYCDDCDISIDDFKEPYHKIPIHYLIILAIFYIVVIWMNILRFGFGAEFTYTQDFIFYIPLHLFTIILTIQAIRMRIKGFRKCNKCKREVSFKAKYCIYCGHRLGSDRK
jgi:predicted amidophosphoribosyltransferase